MEGASDIEKILAGPATENPGWQRIFKLRHWPPGTNKSTFVPFFFAISAFLMLHQPIWPPRQPLTKAPVLR
jgi:hypothetical protein